MKREHGRHLSFKFLSLLFLSTSFNIFAHLSSTIFVYNIFVHLSIHQLLHIHTLQTLHKTQTHIHTCARYVQTITLSLFFCLRTASEAKVRFCCYHAHSYISRDCCGMRSRFYQVAFSITLKCKQILL